MNKTKDFACLASSCSILTAWLLVVVGVIWYITSGVGLNDEGLTSDEYGIWSRAVRAKTTDGSGNGSIWAVAGVLEGTGKPIEDMFDIDVTR